MFAGLSINEISRHSPYCFCCLVFLLDMEWDIATAKYCRQREIEVFGFPVFNATKVLNTQRRLHLVVCSVHLLLPLVL